MSSEETPSSIVHRVNQLDAVRLDEELIELFRSQMFSSVRLLKSSTVEALHPELSALLRLVYFGFTVMRDIPSPGNQYQNLRYRDGSSSTQRVLVRYAWQRLDRVASQQRWADAEPGSPQKLLWRAMRVAEKSFSVLSTLNFLIFIWRGVFRTLEDRLMNARLDYIKPNAIRTVTFEFLNRQLVWEGFTDFVLFMAPLLRSSRWLGILRAKAASALGILSGGRDVPLEAMPSAEDGLSCKICQKSTLMMPHFALPCNHRFCYTCITSKIETEASYRCPICATVVEDVVRDRY